MQKIRAFPPFPSFSTTFPATPHPPLAAFVVLHVRGGGIGGWKSFRPLDGSQSAQSVAGCRVAYFAISDIPGLFPRYRVLIHHDFRLSPPLYGTFRHLLPVVFDTFGAGCHAVMDMMNHPGTHPRQSCKAGPMARTRRPTFARACTRRARASFRRRKHDPRSYAGLSAGKGSRAPARACGSFIGGEVAAMHPAPPRAVGFAWTAIGRS